MGVSSGAKLLFIAGFNYGIKSLICSANSYPFYSCSPALCLVHQRCSSQLTHVMIVKKGSRATGHLLLITVLYGMSLSFVCLEFILYLLIIYLFLKIETFSVIN